MRTRWSLNLENVRRASAPGELSAPAMQRCQPLTQFWAEFMESRAVTRSNMWFGPDGATFRRGGELTLSDVRRAHMFWQRDKRTDGGLHTLHALALSRLKKPAVKLGGFTLKKTKKHHPPAWQQNTSKGLTRSNSFTLLADLLGSVPICLEVMHNLDPKQV